MKNMRPHSDFFNGRAIDRGVAGEPDPLIVGRALED
jgi:hypothetical protein